MRNTVNQTPVVGSQVQAPAQKNRTPLALGAGAVALFSAVPAFAIDVSAVTTEISSTKADLESIGVAIIGVVVVVMVVNMIRRLLR